MFTHFKYCGVLALAGLALLSSVTPAMAAPITFFDHDPRTLSTQPFPNSLAARSNFLNQVTALGGTPYHQNLTSGIPNGANPSFAFPGSTISATTENLTFQFVTFFAVNDTNNGSASSALIETEVATGTGTTPTVNSINFNQPINAFGLYLCQVGDVLGHPITFRLENTLLGTSQDLVIDVGPSWSAFAIAYLGIIDPTSSFNRFSMIENTDVDGNSISDDLQDGIILDNLTVAVVVPEPGSLVLLGLGAIPLGLAVRRARKR